MPAKRHLTKWRGTEKKESFCFSSVFNQKQATKGLDIKVLKTRFYKAFFHYKIFGSSFFLVRIFFPGFSRSLMFFNPGALQSFFSRGFKISAFLRMSKDAQNLGFCRKVAPIPPPREFPPSSLKPVLLSGC